MGITRDRTLADRRAAAVTALCRYIEKAERTPTLDELAQRAGWSPHHLHRIFKSVTGLTPRAYAAARRDERVRRALGASATVTEAYYSAGYGSSGRFYEASDSVLGMTPARYRSGGAGEIIRYACGRCSLGELLVARSERGVCAILIGEARETLERDLARRFPRAERLPAGAGFERTLAKVVALVEAPTKGFDLPLDIRGTAFQHRVWQALRAIPAGETVSYGALANRIGAPQAVRAVAQACAANALAVAVPCHRVVASDGALTGYRWGVERKRALLEREAGGGRGRRRKA